MIGLHILILKPDVVYYVETEEDLVPKFNPGIEDFYERLRSERLRSDEEILLVKSVFEEQGINFQDLMTTGDLALTEEKLEKIGIKRMGLRTAILSVIRSYK